MSDQHSWVYHDIQNNRQVVRCARCGKWDSYFLSGYKPQPPVDACEGLEYEYIVVRVPRGELRAG